MARLDREPRYKASAADFAELGQKKANHLARMANATESVIMSDFTAAWVFLHNELNTTDFSVLGDYYKRVALPIYAQTPDQDKFRLAHILTLIDSRTIDAETRLRIGLTEKPPRNTGEKNPSFFIPGAKSWKYQCADAERYMIQADQMTYEYNKVGSAINHRMKRQNGVFVPQKRSYKDVDYPIEFLGCLAGKSFDLISGLCFETKEFPNGTVFLEDVWYMLRGPYDLIAQVRDLNRDNFVRRVDGLLKNKQKDLGDWKNCGGIWQPSRALHHTHDLDGKYVEDPTQVQSPF